ncbi:MAG: hypothetical protein OQK82_07865 [Candidatus Pacearchaeota archaeon]|nr:hypothetical protein [Candidatus Pacearchaeota archaeon]
MDLKNFRKEDLYKKINEAGVPFEKIKECKTVGDLQKLIDEVSQ